ncbi:hypothetical protein B0T22DRAFT_436886 [Podospora appendiculata]|uniref:CFEM domain-containing protein n=1 Tax=Podospora appendiculata TaxID=314037 RepID=A0AAE0XI92_9PEZI|nr:hypothetical protein B0T22DRAFT_436886 [Podospora appendiculata]
MKLSFIQLIGALLAAAGAHAQLSGCAAVAVKAIPSCAQSCFIDNAPAVGCGGFDFACQCQKEAAFFAAIESCVASSCASSLFQDVIDGAALGSGGSMTVSGTVVPGTVAHGTVGTVIGTVVGTFVTTPTATATTTPESTFQTSSSSAPASTAVPSSSTNGGGSGGTPTASQSFGATASTVSAANRHLSFEVGLALSAFTAMLAFLTL